MRLNDRDFRIWDELILRRFDPDKGNTQVSRPGTKLHIASITMIFQALLLGMFVWELKELTNDYYQ